MTVNLSPTEPFYVTHITIAFFISLTCVTLCSNLLYHLREGDNLSLSYSLKITSYGLREKIFFVYKNVEN